MSSPHYEPLTRLDESFLVYESARAPMHVGSVHTFEAGPLRGAGGAIDLDRVRRHVEAKLHRIPRYRQRLARTPIAGRPVWIDDDRFNLRYHLRHARLPHPGDERQLKRMAGRVLSQRLDRGKPLWELWLVEGLEGDRVALLSKIHHCMIDGVSGADLLAVLLGDAPAREAEPPPAWRPRRAPGSLELARDELLGAAATPFRLAAELARLAGDPSGTVGGLGERVRATAGLVGTLVPGPTETSLNQPVGPHRRIDWLSFSLDDLRAVKDVLGGTVNDVVLATAAGALRRFLTRSRLERVERLRFQVMVPVSLRGAEERGGLGNRVSAWIVELPLGEPDARRRFEAVRRETRRMKERHQALGAETLTRVTEWTGTGLLGLGARLVEWHPPFNMVITNVPGPPGPLYLLDSRMLEAHPVVPLLGSLSTGLALFSYAGRLSFGFAADWELVPDLHDLVLATEDAFGELRHAAGLEPTPRARPSREDEAGAAEVSATPPTAEEPAPGGEPLRLGPEATPGQVRRRILQDHTGLRGQLAELESLARRILAGERGLEGRLVERGGRLRRRFLEHLDLEDAHLVPALREADAWGEERARRVAAEHVDQRQRLDELLEDLHDATRSPRALAYELQHLARDLLEDMEQEERGALRRDVLRDDVVSISAETG